MWRSLLISVIVTLGLVSLLVSGPSVADPAYASPESASAPRYRVLIVVSHNLAHRWTSDVVNEFRLSLDCNLGNLVDYSVIELNDWGDSIQGDNEAFERLHSERSKLKSGYYDLLFALDDHAVDTVMRMYAVDDFSCPLLFAGYSRPITDGFRENFRNCTGLLRPTDVLGTIALGRTIYPEAKKIYVLIDSSTIGASIKQRIEASPELSRSGVDVEFLGGDEYAFEKIMPILANAPMDSFIVVTSLNDWRINGVNRDGELCAKLNSVSKLPFLGVTEDFFHHGQIGGSIIPAQEHAAKAALMAQRVLEKGSAESIKIDQAIPRQIVDLAIMQRCGISASVLPHSVQLLQGTPSFWAYREVPAVWFCLTGIIVALFLAWRNHSKLTEANKRLAVFDSFPVVAGAITADYSVVFSNQDSHSDRETVSKTEIFPLDYEVISSSFTAIVVGKSVVSMSYMGMNGPREIVAWPVSGALSKVPMVAWYSCEQSMMARALTESESMRNDQVARLASLESTAVWWQAMAENCPVGLSILDAQNHYAIKLVNEIFCKKFTSWSGVDDVVGKTVFQLFPAEVARELRSSEVAAMDAGVPTKDVNIIVDQDGLEHYCATLRIPVESAEGKMLFGATVDVTDLVLAQQSRIEACEMLSAFADLMSDVLVCKDVDNGFRYRYVNDAFCKMVGLSHSDVINKTDSELFVSSESIAAVQRLHSLTVGVDEPVESELTMLDNAGRQQVVRVVSRRLRTTNGTNLLLMSGSIITDEKSLAQSDEYLDNVLGKISTEFDYDVSLATVFEAAATIIGCERLTLGEYRPKQTPRFELVFDWHVSGTPALSAVVGNQLEPAYELGEKLFLEHRDLVINDVKNSEYNDLLSRYSTKSMMVAPVFIKNQLFGAVVVGSIRQKLFFSRRIKRVVAKVVAMVALLELRRAQLASMQASIDEKVQILGYVNSPVWVFDSSAKLLHANNAACKLVDVSPSEAMSMPCYRSFCRHDCIPEDCLMMHAMVTGEPAKHSIVLGGRTILITAYPIKNAEGKVVKVIQTGVDITDAQVAKHAVPDAKAMIGAVIESIPFPVVVKDVANGLRNENCNELYCQAVKLRREEIIGYNEHDFVSLPFEKPFDSQMGTNRQGEQSSRCETVKVTTREGITRTYARHELTLSYGTNGDLLMVIYVDVSELEALQRYHNTVSTVQASMINGVSLHDEITLALENLLNYYLASRCFIISFSDDGAKVDVVREVCAKGVVSAKASLELLPVSVIDSSLKLNEIKFSSKMSTDVQDSKWSDWAPFCLKNGVESLYCLALYLGGKAHAVLAVSFEHGKQILCDDQLSLLRNIGQCLAAVLDYQNGRAELAQASKALADTRTANSSYMSGLLKALQQPLSEVIDSCDLISQGLDSPEFSTHFSRIKAAGFSLVRYIEDLGVSAAVCRGELAVNRQYVDAGKLIASLIDEYRQLAKERHTVVETFISSLPILELDAENLRLALDRLLRASVLKAASCKIMVQVSFVTSSEDTGVLICSVSDSSSEDWPMDSAGQLGEVLSQGSEAVIPDGLDLSISTSRQLIELMGGVLIVRRAVGGGYQIVVRFDQVGYRNSEESKQVSAELKNVMAKQRWLLVDDVRSNLDLLEARVKRLGIEAVCVESGAQALSLAERDLFTAVVTELWMPGLNGLELMRKLRSLPGYADVPIVAITADIVRSRSLPMQEFDLVIPMPVSSESLALISKLRHSTD